MIPGCNIRIVKTEMGSKVFIDDQEIKFVRDIIFKHRVGHVPTLELEIIAREVLIEADGVETIIEKVRPERMQERAPGYNPRPPADSKPPPPEPPPSPELIRARIRRKILRH